VGHDAIGGTRRGNQPVGCDARPGRFRNLATGKVADFLVLDANPLDDIRNTQRISQVYLRGRQVDRGAFRARWSGRAGTQ
jgi:cytosine/adenosine deaminase-related metal-dependent hydrolase